MTLLFTKKRSLQCQRPFFVPLFNFVGMLLRHIHRYILLSYIKRGIVPHGDRITVELITVMWRRRSKVTQHRVICNVLPVMRFSIKFPPAKCILNIRLQESVI